MKNIIKWIVIAVIAIVVLSVIFGGGDDKAVTNTADDTAAAEPVVVETITVTAKELISDYENNEMAADKKYKGKVLKVTGLVKGIDSGFNDNAVVQLGTNAEMEFASVSATGDKAFDEAAVNLNKGQELTVVCTSEGEVIGMPQLDECVIN